MAKPLTRYLIIAVVSLICYWNSLECDLVHDDIFAIKENQDLHPSTPWSHLFKNDFWGKSMTDNTSHKSYRPLTIATFRLNYSLHGVSPFGYHLVNVLLHMAVSLLFLYFCDVNIFLDKNISFVTVLLFTTHPIHTEAVTGVVGRADILACLFFLISLHIYMRSMGNDDDIVPVNNNINLKSGNIDKKMPLTGVFIITCMAMLCKENGITAIGVCFILEVFPRKEELKRLFLKKLDSSGFERLSTLLRRVSVLVVMAALLLFVRICVMRGQMPAFNEEDNPASFSKSIATRLMTYCFLCAFNIWLLLFPYCLSYDWQVGSIPLVESFMDIRNVYTILTFTVLAALVIRIVTTKKDTNSFNAPLIGITLLAIPFLPASNLFFRVGFVVAERILYIPSLGFCILCGHGFSIVLSRLQKENSPSKIKIVNGSSHHQEATLYQEHAAVSHLKESKLSFVLWASLFLLISTFIMRTIDRNEVWKSRETLFRSGIEILPHNAKVHYNYANLMKDTGMTTEAINHYKTAIQLYPKHASSHNNLATVLGMSEEAEHHFKQTLIHNPYHYKAMYNLASLYREKGKNKEAKKLLEYCLNINPNYFEAVQVLADVLHDLGDTQKALDSFYHASLRCHEANFFNSYGVFLGNLGKGESALKAYEKALEIDPNHKLSIVNYGRQLKMMGNYKEAEVMYRRALKIGRDGNTLSLLAVLLYQTGRLKECELAFSEALRYEPKNEDYIKNHATAIFEQGQKESAIDLMKQAQRMFPKSSGIVKLLVNFLMTMNRAMEALEAITTSLNFNSDDDELHFMKANAQKDLNNLELALESYKDAVRLNPKHFSSLQNIGVIYHLRGFKTEAKHFYEKALEIEPNNKILKENIAKLLRTMKHRRH